MDITMYSNIYNINSGVKKNSVQKTDNLGIRLSDFVREFLSYASSDRRPGTVKIFKAALKKFVEMTNDIFLSDLTARHFDRYKSLRASQISPTTTNIELRALRAAFRTAVRWKYLSSDPFLETRLIPIPQTEKAFISQSDFPKLISTIREPWLRDTIFFAALTGLRREELISLTKSDYDAVNNQIVIKSNANFKTKNGKIRVIPLALAAQYIIKSRLELNASEYVFYLKDGKKISGDYLTHKFKKYVRQVGLSEEIRLHSLRHSYASWLAQNGTNLFVLQRLLGHGNISTTQIYAHLSMNDLRSGVLNLPDFKQFLNDAPK